MFAARKLRPGQDREPEVITAPTEKVNRQRTDSSGEREKGRKENRVNVKCHHYAFQ